MSRDIELMTLRRDLAHANYSLINDELQLVAKEAEVEKLRANLEAHRGRIAQLGEMIAEREVQING